MNTKININPNHTNIDELCSTINSNILRNIIKTVHDNINNNIPDLKCWVHYYKIKGPKPPKSNMKEVV